MTIRYIGHHTGFGDGTAFIRWNEHEGHYNAVNPDGREGPKCLVERQIILRHLQAGAWIELTEGEALALIGKAPVVKEAVPDGVKDHW